MLAYLFTVELIAKLKLGYHFFDHTYIHAHTPWSSVSCHQKVEKMMC